MSRIVGKNDLVEIVKKLKSKGKKIGTTNGCFDVLHYGHIWSLNEAKKHCDILILGLNSDDSVRRLKGPLRPINNEDTRAYVLSNIRPVDYIYVFGEDDPTEFLKLVKPAVHVKSEEGYKGIEGPVLKKWKGKLVLLEVIPGYSTSKLLSGKNGS